ncbi:MAG: 2-oxo acid dehydrogenase subunit E2 [Tannerella sp.]|jgi:pyruvate dehydrogenase E2 component (dihydrolipoamide acetyltransferase)|nr:2-oxo acid dehydrogenase subunit E2 [Tannerella sp.]
MATVVIMPKQGQSVESCILTEIKKKKGDAVEAGEVLFAYETDKAAFEEEAKVSGTVLEVFYREGDEIPVLEPVMVIGVPGESVADMPLTGGRANVDESHTDELAGAAELHSVRKSRSNPVKINNSDISGTGESDMSSFVSPRAKTLAEKHALDASKLTGTGPQGRVIERDVQTAIDATPKTTPLAKAIIRSDGKQLPETGTGLAGMVRGDDLTTQPAAATAPDSVIVPLTNVRKLIAKAMYASLQNSAQLTHHLGADARRILSLRKKVKKAVANGYPSDITLNDMICRAVILALKKFPSANAHFLGDSTRNFSGIHLGFAVDTERGLMVPAIPYADGLSIQELSASMKEIAEACKKGSVNPDLLAPEAASFTVSNLGNYGVEMFTPIINLPQVAILGVNTIVPRPKELEEGVYGFVPYLGLSLTYDHRAIDGGYATRFLKQIAIEIENLEIETINNEH